MSPHPARPAVSAHLLCLWNLSHVGWEPGSAKAPGAWDGQGTRGPIGAGGWTGDAEAYVAGLARAQPPLTEFWAPEVGAVPPP